MSSEVLDAFDTTREEAPPRRHSPSVLPLLESLRATLANIDWEHEHEVAKLRRSTAPASVKTRVLAGIDQRHKDRREPYARHLAILQQRGCDQAV